MEYIVGESLEKEGGRFTVVLKMKRPKRMPWQMSGVEVTGFWYDREGRQTTPTITKELGTSFDVPVNPNQLLNDEYLAKIGWKLKPQKSK